MKRVNKTCNTFKFLLSGIMFCIIVLLTSTSQVHAQDTIYFFKSPPIVVKVIEVESKNVRYKKLSLPDGPDYIVPIKTIKNIVYSDGRTATLYPIPQVTAEKKPFSWDFLKGQTHINLIVTDFFWALVGIEAEYNLFKGKMGIKIPFSVGLVHVTGIDSSADMDLYDSNILFNGAYGYYNRNKTFSTGVELYAYVSGNEMVNYYVGPAFGYGEFSYVTKVYPYNPSKPVGYLVNDAYYYSYFVKNGVRIQPVKYFNISISLGTGAYFTTFKNSFPTGITDTQHHLSMEGKISLGYTF